MANRILFSKTGKSIYISHLDLMRTLQRSFLRAGIKIKHTEGYHPHPYVSIPLPLPLGFSSDCEVLEFGIVHGATMETLPEQMNKALPEGIKVLACYDDHLPFRKLTFVRYEIIMEMDSSLVSGAKDALGAMTAQEELIITKKSKKARSGFVELDIIPQIDTVESMEEIPEGLKVTILLRAQNPGLNPALLLKAFGDLHPDLQPEFITYHRLAILDDQYKPYR